MTVGHFEIVEWQKTKYKKFQVKEITP